ncbi:MAG: GTPase domain-containing protein [Methylovulum sp.]|uniref:GTPase n=1 Tax=Methylovulum sp. TaxID=1916980 RepID=UPI00260192AC|nr:GTPase domain-containing protein [Methylovulum sp.]MDD2724064.1 GTPase domain-containing protein [Methylovulum sp.]MDD5123830.1 GTPase domain-containing protein [Methylovulum sp.]
MLEFIQLLKQRYQAIVAQPGKLSGNWDYQRRIAQLTLAEAFLRKGQWLESKDKQVLQVAVIGPTQAGKSSLVNVLLNSQAAGVSPLAGYTVHPQGFCHGVGRGDSQGLQRYFGRFQCLPREQLGKQRYDCYALSENTVQSPYLPACVLWDTPDFDSIDSETYREGVLRAIALADVLILVVSKEKYADQSVWEMMAEVAALNQPTLICMNKLAEGSESLLLPSLKEKWQQARSDTFPDVIPLYYQKNTGVPLWPAGHKNAIAQLAKKISHHKHARFEQALLQKHWQAWLEPVREEHQLLDDWQTLLDSVLEQALSNYQRDYLNHPHHYETFHQAMAELLTLLEIPGLAGFMTGARKALTWPMRQMVKLGRKRLHITDSSHEVKLLDQLAEHALIQLADHLLDKTGQGKQRDWWQGLSALLRRQRPGILQEFTVAVKDYHLAFQQDVEESARHLYHKLQEQPMVLNSLRATRVTADAVVIALTLHTGGIGVHDLVIAPALLTVTSLLAESAIGSYMHKVEAHLKQQQLKAVNQALFAGILMDTLKDLPEQLASATHFNISPEQMRAMEQQLTEKRHGLRLL